MYFHAGLDVLNSKGESCRGGLVGELWESQMAKSKDVEKLTSLVGG